MPSPVTIILGAISLVCSMLMYYNMRHAIDLKRLRAEVSSVSLLVESGTTQIEGLKLNEAEIKESIRKLTELRLAPIKKSLADLQASERLLHAADSSSSLMTQSRASQLSEERINYADMHLGARVESTDYAPVKTQTGLLPLFGIFSHDPHSAQNILHANMRPGACFAFKGSEATLKILLSEAIYVEALEIQHITKYESPTKELSSAPREFSVYGLDAFGLRFKLGDFEFKNSLPFQLYFVKSDKVCERILVHFRTNHGNPHYTCVYRVAVYGQPKQ